jgi:hypothetical protein
VADTDAKTTGTTAGAGGDAAKAVAGTTPNAVDRNAEPAGAADVERQELEALRREKNQWLAEKTNYERLKSELDARETEAPTTYSQGGNDQATRVWQEIYDDARAGDAKSIAMLHGFESLHKSHTAKVTELERKLEKLTTPEAERAEVESEFKTGDYTSWEAARRGVQAKKLLAQKQQLEAERQKLEAEMKAKEAGVVSMSTRSVTGKELGAEDEMERAHYLERMRDDSIPFEERALLRRKYESGKLKLH